MYVSTIPLNINKPHTAIAAILDIYLGLVEPADSRSQSMYYLQNPVNGLTPFRVLVAQLVEHPPGVRKVMGSNPIGDSDFFPSFLMYVSTFPLNIKKSVFIYLFRFYCITTQRI